MDEDACGSWCFLEPNCASFNFKQSAGNRKCEMNNSTHEEHEAQLEENPNYLYRGAKVN